MFCGVDILQHIANKLFHVTTGMDRKVPIEYSIDIFYRPYDGKWSKSMVGYGPEDNHFVVELTYNYGIKEYKVGNDFQVGLEFYLKGIGFLPK